MILDICFFAVVLNTLAQIPAEPSMLQQEQAKFIGAAIRNEREKLRQYVVSADWLHVTRKPNRPETSLKSSIRIWADHDAGSYRMDRRDRATRDTGDSEVVHEMKAQFVRTPDCTLHADYPSFDKPGSAAVMLPTEPSHITLVDVRNIGLAMPQEIGLTHEDISSFFWDQKLESIDRESGDVVRVAWNFGSPADMRRTIWVDEKNGYTITRMEVAENVDGKWSPPRWAISIDWKNLDDVWVPTLMKGEQSNARASVVLNLVWETLNTPIEKSVFTIDGLSLSPGTYVTDGRLAVPVLLDVVGQNAVPPSSLPTLPVGSWTSYVIAGGALAACVVIVVLWWQRARQRA